MIRELKTEEIRLSEPVTEFDDIEGGSRIIGQERAMSLLSLGLSIDRVGYNIFLSGDDGSGRLTAVMESIEKIRSLPCHLRDAAYAWAPDSLSPRLLIFEQGNAGRVYFRFQVLAYDELVL